jgi:hypothetical protein
MIHLFKTKPLMKILINSLKLHDNKLINKSLKTFDCLFIILNHKEIHDVFTQA